MKVLKIVFIRSFMDLWLVDIERYYFYINSIHNISTKIG